MGSLDDLKQRIEALNGGPLREKPKPAVAQPTADATERRRSRTRRALLPETAPVPPAHSAPLPAATGWKRHFAEEDPEPVGFRSLTDLVRGEEALEPGWGGAWVVTQRARDLGEEGAALCSVFSEAIQRRGFGLSGKLHALCGGRDLAPEDFLFMDLETTGLSNLPVFLVGVMAWEGDSLVVRQYFARRYSEEPAITAAFRREAQSRRLIVTFNGKSFDMPFLRNRAATHGIPYEINLPHLDLLHESRRAWSRQLPNCKLQTLEASICRRRRVGDTPGSEIPGIYHAFVRTGDARRIAGVLKHNMLDLLTLAELLALLPP